MLTTTEEAQTRALIAQQAAILSLASSEPTIISKLGATKVSLADLTTATSLNDADLFLVRQGVTEKSTSLAVLTPPSSDTVKGIIELATSAETITGTDATRAVTPAGLQAKVASETAIGLVELATVAEAIAGVDTARAVTPAGLSSSVGKQIQSITATVAASALTLGLNPTTLQFRSTPLTSGTVNSRTVGAAISLVVPSTATLGTVNAIQSRLVLLAIDNAGTVELAVVNITGGNNLDETTLINTVAVDAASDAANVIYSATARTGVPFRVVGYVESTQATAGTWATAPSTIQGMGGQALAAMSSLGYGQTWQNVTGSRVSGATYYNTTGKPILVVVTITQAGGNTILTGTPIVGGVTLTTSGIFGGTGIANVGIPLTFIVPPGQSYSFTVANGSITGWSELR